MIKTHIKAGYAGLWFLTHEERRTIDALIADLPNGYRAYEWDVVAGLKDHTTGKAQPLGDPLKAISTIMSLPNCSVMFLKDFHRFLGDIEIVRTLKNLLEPMKKSNRHFVMVSPIVNIPKELEKDIHQMDFPLPTEAELQALAEKLIADNELKIEVKPEVIRSSKGLTLLEAENSFSRSIIETKGITKSVLEGDKLQVIRKSGLLELVQPISPDQLVMPLLMKYIENRKRGFVDPSLPTPHGILLAGLPGAGKSLSAKVLAYVLGVPLIRMDLGSLKAGHVGESEANLKNALAQIDAVGMCVIWMDEVEKVLSGVQSSGKTDGGTTANMFGTLLTYMQESKEPHYFAATCNDMEDVFSISQGAFIRRFDDTFFVDLPSPDERMQILKIMNRRYKTNIDLSLSDRMENWTGAEIEKMVVGSIYDGIEEAFAQVKPIFLQNQAKIEAAREWAKFNARRANGETQKEGQGRRLSL